MNYDRTAMRRSLIALLLAVAAPACAQDLLAPLPIRDQFLLNQGFLFFEPEDARALERGDVRVSLSEASANTFAKSAWISYNLAGESGRSSAAAELAKSRFRGEGPLFLADGESHRFEMALRRGFGANLELGLTVPVIQIGGGWSDFLVESVHHAFGLGNAGRDTLKQNKETIYIQTASTRYLRTRSTGYGIGSVALSGKYELRALEDKSVALAVAGVVTSKDGGVEMLLSRDIGRSRLHGSIGIVRLAADRTFGTPAQILSSATIGAARLLNDRTSATVQLTVSESPFRNAGLAELGKRSNQLSIGVQRQVSRSMTAYVALIENVLNYENSADAGLAIGIRADLN